MMVTDSSTRPRNADFTGKTLRVGRWRPSDGRASQYSADERGFRMG
jgi:hypothetical protein